MKWAAVEIEHADEATATQSADELMNVLFTVAQEKRAPPDFEVWHLQLGPAHHVYYLSPRFALAAEGRLSKFEVQALPFTPKLEGAKKVML